MNIQQFLAEEPIDKLFHQFFSIEGQSEKSKSQQNILINSIVLCIASNHNFTFKNLYQQCQYQLQVNNQQRDAINKLCRLVSGVIGKAPYLLKNVQNKFFVDQVLQFLLSKVFVTVCSAECIRCIWALVNAFSAAYPFSNIQLKNNKSCCSIVQKTSCCGSSEMKDESSECCQNNNSSTKLQSNCCSTPNQPQQLSMSSLISKHEQVCKSIVGRFLNTFKLHVKAYPFKVRKDIYKLILYVLKFTRFSQQHFLKSFSQHERYEMQNFQAIESQPLFVEIGITKQQLIETTIKNLADQKDPRNMQLIFQNYLALISLFAQQICVFNYRQQLFENIEVYYPLSMEGDQSGFQIDEEDRFSEFELKGLLDQCLLQDIFCNEVRELLVEKMSAPPINDYVSLYVKYISRFNPKLWKSKLVNMKLHEQKYIVLTLNLLQRLCEEQYLDESYSAQAQGHCQDSGDSCCGGNKSKGHMVQFSISQLIATIIKNVFISPLHNSTYSTYSVQIEQKFIQFLTSLIVSKLFNTSENHKHAGTIIDIVKTVLHSEIVAKNVTEIKNSKVSKAPKQSSSCCSTNNNDSCCSTNDNNDSCCSTNNAGTKTKNCETQTSSFSSKQAFGRKVNFEQMLTNFVILKFMQYWSGKGDVAFKLGLLIIVLNKKLESVSIEQFKSPQNDESTQTLLEHLLISLGNVYQTYIQTDQVRIMVLKTLMIIVSIYNKLYESDSTKRQKGTLRVTKINNSIIHKDCINLSQFLNTHKTNDYQSKQQVSKFDKSEQPILKSYIDYIMEMYVSNQKGQLNQETSNIVKNIFSSVLTNSHQNLDKQHLIQVKLYALVRYLSIIGHQNLSLTGSTIQLCHLFVTVLLSSNKQINKKLTTLLKYYNYQTVLSLFGLIFAQIASSNKNINSISTQKAMQTFFINLSSNGKILKDKFQQHHIVQLQNCKSALQHIHGDLQDLCTDFRNINICKYLSWYMLKDIWRSSLSNSTGNQKSIIIALNNALINQTQNKAEESLESRIIKSVSSRLLSFINLYENQRNFQNITLDSTQSDIQCSLIYVKYLKFKNQQQRIKFNPNLGNLYDPGMIEYFWNRLFSSITYQEKSIISIQKKTELVGLLEYLPQKILVNYAEKVTPLVIYTTNNSMKDQKSSSLNQKDEFDFSMSKLISKLCPTLPQQSLITYVLPYCLQYLRIAAISCQNNTDIPSNINPLSQTINTILSISKIVQILIEKSQQKTSQKGFFHQKLKKAIFQTHKKEFRQYYGKLVYHKKRLIRQSSRYLLSSFD